MSRRKSIPGEIIRWFDESPLDAVEAIFSAVSEKVRSRRAASRPVLVRKTARKSKASSSSAPASTEAAVE